MEFENKIKIPLLLEPRSLLVLSKDARFIWTHSILARKRDRSGILNKGMEFQEGVEVLEFCRSKK